MNILKSRIFFGVLFLFTLFVFSQNAAAQSTISGTIYDKQRTILSDVDVELLNDYYQTIARTKTDAAGRYQFNGLTNGRYSVRVYAFRYDVEDQTLPVEINTVNIRGGEGVGYFPLDFYLLPKKGGLAEAELGVVFAQDVPPDAKKLYDRAVKDLSAKRMDEGVNGLNEAIQLFPQYYDALYRMGRELVVAKKYEDAVGFLIKAIEVNDKSATALYYLGYAFHNLDKKYNKAAITALTRAHELAPASLQVLIALGKVERDEGKFEAAEQHFLQAKKLTKTPIAEIHKQLAQLYSNNMKKYKEAADELELYLKVSNLEKADQAQTKKVIADLREKAKNQTN